MCGHQLVEHNIIEIKQKRPQSSRQPNAKKRRQMRSTRQPVKQRKVQNRAVQPKNSNHKVSARNSIGKRRSDARAQNLMPARQQHKHEQRIQDHINNAAHGNSKPGLLRQPDIAQQVRHRHCRDRRRRAQDNNTGAVLFGKFKRLLARPQQCQQRTHEHSGHYGKK